MDNNKLYLVKTLAHCAEVCSALTISCLQMARVLKQENADGLDYQLCLNNVNKGSAQVMNLIEDFVNLGLLSCESIDSERIALNKNNAEKYISVEEAAKKMDVGVATVYAWISLGMFRDVVTTNDGIFLPKDVTPPIK